MKRAALAVLFAGCAHVSALVTDEDSPQPGLHLTSRIVHYAVHGATLAEARAQMARLGPIDDGGHQFAKTWGTYAWHWQHAPSSAGCAIGAVDVELEIEQTFPSWIDRASVDGASSREWDRWLAATADHEHGHREILLATAGALLDTLRALAPKPDCPTLDAAAGAAADALLDEMRARHAAFDRETRHGATTGAVLHDKS